LLITDGIAFILYEKLLEENTEGMKRANFFLHVFFISKSIGNFIIDGLTDKPIKFIDECFTNEAFPSINLRIPSYPHKSCNIYVESQSNMIIKY
jgi:hypothetical protein